MSEIWYYVIPNTALMQFVQSGTTNPAQHCTAIAHSSGYTVNQTLHLTWPATVIHSVTSWTQDNIKIECSFGLLTKNVWCFKRLWNFFAENEIFITNSCYVQLYNITKQHETYLLIPWNRILLQKLTGAQQVKKFSSFYGSWNLIITSTITCHLSISWASLWKIGIMKLFYDEKLLALYPTPKLEDYRFFAVLEGLFNIFKAILHIGGCSSIDSLKMCHAVVTWTHLSGRIRHTSLLPEAATETRYEGLS